MLVRLAVLLALPGVLLAGAGVDKAYHFAGAAGVTGGIYALARVCRVEHRAALWTAVSCTVAGCMGWEARKWLAVGEVDGWDARASLAGLALGVGVAAIVAGAGR